MFGRLLSGLEVQNEVSRLLDGLYDSSAQVAWGKAEGFGASQRGAKDLSEKGAYEEKSTGRFVLEFNPKHSFSFVFQNAAPFGYHERQTSTRGVAFASAGAASVPPKLGRLAVDTLSWVLLQRRAS